MARILVINPNSSAVVTAAMDRALDPLRAADGPEIVCVTNRDGPAGIESQADADLAAVQTAAMVAAASVAGADAPDAADAYVIACFSDPWSGGRARRNAKAGVRDRRMRGFGRPWPWRRGRCHRHPVNVGCAPLALFPKSWAGPSYRR